MKKFLLIIPLILFIVGCSAPKQTTVEKVVYTYRDSLVIKDSIRTVILPVEVIKDITPAYDTLHIETSLASSKTWVDTTLHMLKGEMRNKPIAKIPVPVTEHTVFRDSLVYKEIPVEVKVPVKTHPKYERWLWVYMIVTLALMGFKLWLKFRP